MLTSLRIVSYLSHVPPTFLCIILISQDPERNNLVLRQTLVCFGQIGSKVQNHHKKSHAFFTVVGACFCKQNCTVAGVNVQLFSNHF